MSYRLVRFMDVAVVFYIEITLSLEETITTLVKIPRNKINNNNNNFK